MVTTSRAIQRAVALVFLFVAFTAPPEVQAQHLAVTNVTLLTAERGMVNSRAVATKDIVSHVTAQRGSRTGMHIVMIRTCPKIPPETIQAMMKELEARRFVVGIDFNDPDPSLCLG